MLKFSCIWKLFTAAVCCISCSSIMVLLYCESDLERSQQVDVSYSSDLDHLHHEQIVKQLPPGLNFLNEINISSVEYSALTLSHTALFNNEFEAVPFVRFTVDRLYPVEPGLGRRVIEKPIGHRKQEIKMVIGHALAELNKKAAHRHFSSSDFIEGIYRHVPSSGTHYELYFRDKTQYCKVVMVLPLIHSVIINSENIPPQKNALHIVMTLSGRTETFRNFMNRFEQIFQNDPNLTLTITYFGIKGLNKVKSIVSSFTLTYPTSEINVISVIGAFSRGKGLQIGVDSLRDSKNFDPLIFLCDVDVAFSRNFLERCRLHAERNHSVYYPIVFSLYNPAIVSALSNINSSKELSIGRDLGFWRDFGYGMTCQYKTDFNRIGGFSTKGADEKVLSSGWGLEDVHLYRKHLQTGDLLVIRATDPGIFHLWHEKNCDSRLTPSQYTGCLRSKALSEASQAQLGMMLFRQNERQRHGTL